MKQSRINKVKALAERGIGGEQLNAIAMLEKITAKQVQSGVSSYDSFTVDESGNRVYKATYTVYKSPKETYIAIPYVQFIKGLHNESEVMQAVSGICQDLLRNVTGGPVFQNWTDKIGCVCASCDIADIKRLLETAVYNFLWSIKVPVIHFDGDKAGFACDTDCMEDGTANGIFQYQSCCHYEAPNREAEIFAAINLPAYNRFAALTATAIVWGRISCHDTEAGTITITPLNTKYEAVTLALSDIVHLYRVEHYRNIWQCTSDEEGLQAAMKRYATAIA